jgi:thiopurine S-methyltransferase
MIEHLSEEFWSERYREGQTGWDLGIASPPLVDYFDQLENKAVRILIPGCGNAHEAEYLHKCGFTNVFLIDLAQKPLDDFLDRVDGFPEDHVIHGDIFEHVKKYDLIIEQTLFCAIDPKLREKYIGKISSLLNVEGKYVGVLFDKHFEGGPPFGGDKDEYQIYLRKYFKSIHLESCYNSIGPRLGNELFMIAQV